VTHKTTDIHLYSANEIPSPPEGALKALRPQTRGTTHNPEKQIHEYVSLFYHSVDKSCLPSELEFQDLKAKSLAASQKFKELKDVQIDTFVDVIVQLVKQPYNSDDRSTLWVSDFTENDSFFHFAWKGPAIRADNSADRYEDKYAMPYGADSGGDWKGPFGKLSMQVTCFEPHATYIREQGLPIGSWVMLRNLHIRWGRNGANLEGFLRDDLKINITVMDTTDTESPDPRLKEAIRRKRDYEQLKQAEQQKLFNAAWAGKKRKSDLAEMGVTSSDTSKKNRKKTKKKPMRRDESVTSSAAVSTVSSSNHSNSNGNTPRPPPLFFFLPFPVNSLSTS
jgi:protection-of-telomeres protein 1